MPANRWAAAAVIVAAAAGAADRAAARPFRIPPGPLGDVVAALGVQAGLTITITEPDLAARRSAGVRGDLPVRAALARALQDTGAEAVFYDSATVRIVRSRAPAPSAAGPRPPPPPPPPTDLDELVVTASKQNIRLTQYPGSATIVPFEAGWLSRNAATGTAAITQTLPTLSATNLGRGRNKIYVRGVADSSFNGPTQATVGQYLGDVRLNYSAPDPDLNLYDLNSVEVLAGPQGTLYGASSLGGIVRLVPNPPDSATTYGSAAAGLSATRRGGVGHDGAAMVNLPLGDGAAARLVAYGVRDAGYIDDLARGLKDINRSRVFGQRAMLRFDDVADWTIDLGEVFQTIHSDDGQYTLLGGPPLTRRSALAQPFRNDFRLGYLTARRPLGRRELTTTTSVAGHDLRSVFDASNAADLLRFEERNDILLITHETRLAGGDPNRPWVAGVAAVYNISRLSRTLGPPDAPQQIAGVRNTQLEVSVFGQASRPITPSLTLTVGGRLTGSGNEGQLRDAPRKAKEVQSRKHLHVTPTVALDWRISPSLSTFLEFQQGVRAGGFAISPTGAATGSQEFVADDLAQIELGVRWRNPRRDRLWGRAAIFAVDWNHVQADLIDELGLPYTANIGSGRIYGLDAQAGWRVSDALTLTASGFFNDSDLYDRPDDGREPRRRTLPNIPRDGVRLEAEWRRDLGGGVQLSAGAAMRYVGKSYLASGGAFDVAQGQYIVGSMGARLDFDRFGISLDVANLGDARSNTFAFGNPFGLSRRDQVTPLRPRTVRLGLDTRF